MILQSSFPVYDIHFRGKGVFLCLEVISESGKKYYALSW